MSKTVPTAANGESEPLVPPARDLMFATDTCGQPAPPAAIAQLMTSKIEQMSVKYQSQNAKFRNNITLALVLATYVTLFGLPIYSENVSYRLFGDKLCNEEAIGMKRNVGTVSKPELVDPRSGPEEEGVGYVWCGFLPSAYEKHWPSIVQVTMLICLSNTGTTVKAAWQCLAGTFFAVLNMYIMCVVYPDGAATPGYSPVVAWLDVILVLFLFLASKADMNTRTLGLRFCVVLLLDFMNPNTRPTTGTYSTGIPFVNYDGETTVCLFTSIVGCAIAISATIFPRPLLNIRHVHDETLEVVKGIHDVFQDAITYYKCEKSGALRYQVFAKMKALSLLSSRVSHNLNDSFWETFNLFHFGKVRTLCSSMGVAVSKAESLFYPMRSALDALSFGPVHTEFSTGLSDVLMQLEKATYEVLEMCAHYCKDGVLEPEERDQIKKKVLAIDAKQQELKHKYQEIMNNRQQWLATDSAADSLFIFSCAHMSELVQDWATDLADFEDNCTKSWRNTGFGSACKKFCDIFEPVAMLKKETLRCAAMNAIPIFITFVIAVYANGSVFVQYSSTMPLTLAVLVSNDYGATFFKNLQRLMGVTFGHTLPLLLMSFIELFDCDSNIRFVLHMASLFAFYFVFIFMHHASEHWATIGNLVCAFGCYTLLRPCDVQLEGHYDTKFKDIAATIIAMMVKMLVSNLLSPMDTRDLAIQTLKEAFDQTELAVNCFCEDLIDGDEDKGLLVTTSVRKVKVAVEQCEALAPKCDPIVEIVPDTRTPFKKPLYDYALMQMRLILGDLEMLILAMQGHHVEHTLKVEVSPERAFEEAAKKRKEDRLSNAQEQKIYDVMSRQPAWAKVSGDLKDTLAAVFGVCHAVLKHASENSLDEKLVKSLRGMSNVTSLDGLDDFYRDLSGSGKEISEADKADRLCSVTQLLRTRIGVATNAMALLTEHCAAISSKCFEHMLYF